MRRARPATLYQGALPGRRTGRVRRWTRKRRGVLEEILGGALIPVGLVLLLVLFAALRASVELP